MSSGIKFVRNNVAQSVCIFFNNGNNVSQLFEYIIHEYSNIRITFVH